MFPYFCSTQTVYLVPLCIVKLKYKYNMCPCSILKMNLFCSVKNYPLYFYAHSMFGSVLRWKEKRKSSSISLWNIFLHEKCNTLKLLYMCIFRVFSTALQPRWASEVPSVINRQQPFASNAVTSQSIHSSSIWHWCQEKCFYHPPFTSLPSFPSWESFV